ncbi:MAG TPA: hypothetical protein DCS97_04970, partial [Planctomycetes bacterium]|nr:hypothetical protein [Planctomycetota bacterium]
MAGTTGGQTDTTIEQQAALAVLDATGIRRQLIHGGADVVPLAAPDQAEGDQVAIGDAEVDDVARPTGVADAGLGASQGAVLGVRQGAATQAEAQVGHIKLCPGKGAGGEAERSKGDQAHLVGLRAGTINPETPGAQAVAHPCPLAPDGRSVTPVRMATAIPTQVVIFGASGDLTARKLVPALFSAFHQGHLPGGTQLIGVARRPWDDNGFREHLAQTVGKPTEHPRWAEFLGGVHYVRTHLDTAEDYRELARALDAAAPGPVNRVFYLAVKPELFLPSVAHMHAAGLLTQDGTNGPRRRVVVEKPFGADLGSATVLNQNLLGLLGEDQLYRIDHYL